MCRDPCRGDPEGLGDGDEFGAFVLEVLDDGAAAASAGSDEADLQGVAAGGEGVGGGGDGGGGGGGGGGAEKFAPRGGGFGGFGFISHGFACFGVSGEIGGFV